MYKLKNGSLRTIIYNANDLELYRQAGWTLITEEKKEIKPKKETKEVKDEQNSSKGKSVEK